MASPAHNAGSTSSFVVSNDDLQPKSIVSSETGLFFAQNMMYRHNVMVFDRAGNTVTLIPDDVDLAAFGVADGVQAQGSPVEAVFTPDSKYVYVSNYKMYGDGFGSIGQRRLRPRRLGRQLRLQDQHHQLPDREGHRHRLGAEVHGHHARRHPAARLQLVRLRRVGHRPRDRHRDHPHRRRPSPTRHRDHAGLALRLRHHHGRGQDPRSSTSTATTSSARWATPARRRATCSSPPTTATSTSPTTTRTWCARSTSTPTPRSGTARTGVEPRTMAISDDGESLYVVNYEDGTVSKVRTSDMEILQTEHSGYPPGRHHLRQGDPPGVGGQLRRLAARLRRPLTPSHCGIVCPCSSPRDTRVPRCSRSTATPPRSGAGGTPAAAPGRGARHAR